MQLDTYGQQTQVLSQSANRVLRNTYMLLALTMVPTVAGALLACRCSSRSSRAARSLPSCCSWAFRLRSSGASSATRTAASGWLLLGFTFFMGLMLSRILQVALGFSNGGSMIALAAGGTGAIFVTMAGIASVSKRDFTNMGKFLTVGLVVVLLAMVANIFLQMPVLHLVISAAVVLLFSGYILYDISNIVQGGETNYVTATLAVYLDVYNVFVSLLNLIMAFGGRSRLSPGFSKLKRRPPGRLFMLGERWAQSRRARSTPRGRSAGTCWRSPRPSGDSPSREQHRGVPRQRGGIAGDIDDTPGRRRAQRLDHGNGPPGAGRSASCRAGPRAAMLSSVPRRGWPHGTRCYRRARWLRRFRRPAAPAHRPRPRPHGRPAWQSAAEVAQTAEQVGDALARLRVEQLHRAAHQQAVDAHIDLGEIGGPEGHRHPELGQRVGEPGASAGCRRRHESGPAVGLQPDLHAGGVAKGARSASSFLVNGNRWRNTSTVIPSPTATSICGMRSESTTPHQLMQTRHQRRDMGRGGSGSAHVRDVAAAPLVEADQMPPLLGTWRTVRRAR